MQLISKTERDILKIDTLERGTIFALLQICQGIYSDNNTPQNLTYFLDIKRETATSILTLEIKLPYSPLLFTGGGGDYIRSILTLTEQPINYLGDVLPPTINNNIPIPTEPDYVDTMEKYLAWCLTSWITCHRITAGNQWNQTGYYSFLAEGRPPSLSAKVIFDFDYDTYTRTHNLIEAVQPTLQSIDTNLLATDDDYVFDNSANTSGLVGNEILFGNDFLVGN